MRLLKTKRHPRGVVAIEAALVLPVLVAVILGGLQYGWLFLKQQEITNVARHVVRYATRPDVAFTGHIDGEVSAREMMTNLMTKLGLDGYIIDADTTVAWVPGAPDDDPPGDVGNALYAQISVKAATDDNGSGVDIIGFFPAPAKLTAFATMSKEGP